MKLRAYFISFALGAASVTALSALNEPDPNDGEATIVVEASPQAPVTYMFMLSGKPPQQGTVTSKTKFVVPGLSIGVLSAQTLNGQKVHVYSAQMSQGKPQGSASTTSEYINVRVHGKDLDSYVY